MKQDSTINAARAFVRNLNMLVKTVRLYGLQHEQTMSLMLSAWGDLCTVLRGTGDTGLLLGVSGTQLLLDGVPLETRPTDRSFAQLLSTGGLASIHFLPSVTSEDFSRFVQAFATGGHKSAALIAQIKAALGDPKTSTIRVNEIRFVAQDAGISESGLALQIAAQTLGPAAEELKPWLQDPQKLLQLIAAAEGARKGVSVPPAGAVSQRPEPAALEEEDVTKVIGFLSQVIQTTGGSGTQLPEASFQQELGQLPEGAQISLTQALQALATTAAKPDTPLMLQLAEHIAIRFALASFERGETRTNAVFTLLERLKSQIKSLQQVVVDREEKLGRAGVQVESHAEILDREFWMRVPDAVKRKFLLSPEVWAIPPRNIRQFVEELFVRGENDSASKILGNYTSCIHNPEAETRHKVAVGVTELSDLYPRAGGPVLKSALRHFGERLKHENDQELRSLVGAAFVRLSHQAATRRDYVAVEQTLVSMAGLDQHQAELATALWPRVKAGTRLSDFIQEALPAPTIPPGLIDVLQRMPHATVEQAILFLPRCTVSSERDRLIELVTHLGPEAVSFLCKILQTRPPAEAAAAVGLLSRLDPAALQEWLPKHLREWDRPYHQQVVRQLSLGGSPERGQLLASLFDRIDPLVQPEALDEMGMSRDPSVGSKPAQILEDELREARPSLLGIKAIEALSRLQEPRAVALLRPILEARRLWGWRWPKELRITSAQALAKIDPAWMNRFLPQSGLTQSELRLAPLDPDPGGQWLRSRRYERITLPRSLSGRVQTPQGSSPIDVGTLNLGGGVAACQRHIQPGTLTTIELRPGWQPVRVETLIRESRPQQLTFEVASIGLEDRAKLREFLWRARTGAG
ncbi:MAG: HEAT repeat domain-containing protein [Terriglobia bacterium]|jgi:hypothetical protein